MATRVMEISLALTLVSMLFARHSSAQSLICTTTAMSLAPCLGFITGNASIPSSSCCTQLDTVVKSQARCLCNLLNGSAPMIFGISINRTQALALPGACKVQTPNVSRCNATAPVESPTPKAPAVPSAPKTPSVPKVPSGKGSNTVSPGESSGGNTYESTRATMLSALFLVLSMPSIALHV